LTLYYAPHTPSTYALNACKRRRLTYFWSSGKYRSARSDGSVKAASDMTKASLLARKLPLRSPPSSNLAESSISSRARIILPPTVSVITMLLISRKRRANDCRVSLAEVSCSTERIRSRSSTSQSRGFIPDKSAKDVLDISSCSTIRAACIRSLPALFNSSTLICWH
jgi:hypothetical protein